MKIRELFSRDIDRRIEEVIKVDQTDEAIIREELEEYIVTDSIKKHYLTILEEYAQRPNQPSDAVGVWVSGFFGSGKSSFAKNLGLALAKRSVEGSNAMDLLANRMADPKAKALFKKIDELIPTDAVIFDVSTDRGVRGNQTLTEIMYVNLLEHLGYSRDLDIAELEISLEEDGRLEEFLEAYESAYPKKDWDVQKNRPAFALGEASRVMHDLEPDTYPTEDSWKQGAQGEADIDAGLLADRAKELMSRRGDGRTLAFVVDEVGQFVARDIQKMLELQGIVQSLGRVGRGKMWLVVTSQERLTELVGGLDGQQVELARLMDRFPLQVHLEPSDISEVTSKRVLAKTNEGAQHLREVFDEEQGRLQAHTKIAADIQLPSLTPDRFAELYPLLPYQINLIIDVVSGLRTQGGASRHVGGANRTIIKLAQQLLIHPDVALGDDEVGTLVTLDQIYDLVSGNIPGELRRKISAIRNEVDHPLAQSVAKAVCLLQFVQNIPATKENLAAALHPSLSAESRFAEVEAAVTALLRAHKLREGDRGLRIPSPVEDDWETQRAQIVCKPGDESRILQATLKDLWTPTPTHDLKGARVFKAGLMVGGRVLESGDLDIQVVLADSARFDEEREEARRRSQTEPHTALWVAEVSEELSREATELFRSDQMLTRRGHGAQREEEVRLTAEERRRRERSREEVRRRMRDALLTGSVYFRGHDRDPRQGVKEVRDAVSELLERILPDVFDRFDEGAAKVKRSHVEAVLTADNLQGLPSVFSDLNLVRTQGGHDAIDTESGALAEVLAEITNRHQYGDATSGRHLEEKFGREPFGWAFEVVQLLVACLLRAGVVELRSQNQTIESWNTLDARTVLTNNNKFRAAKISPRADEDVVTAEELVDASTHFDTIFGRAVSTLETGAIAEDLRSEMSPVADRARAMAARLKDLRLAGADVLEGVESVAQEILTSKDTAAVRAFLGQHNNVQHGLDRLNRLENALHDAAEEQIRAAHRALGTFWPQLEGEGSDPGLTEQVDLITEVLSSETFFESFPVLDAATERIRSEHETRWDELDHMRREAYKEAMEQLEATDGWSELEPDVQDEVSAPLRRQVEPAADGTPLSMLREMSLAAESRLHNAQKKLFSLLAEETEFLDVSELVTGPLTSTEQVDAAVALIKDRCLRIIADGKPVRLY